MSFICSSGKSRKRVKIIIKSAVLRASRPGILLIFGLIVPSFGSMANSTVHRKPWCLARILPSCGNASSDRYSSSPLTRTICFPFPGPSNPSKVAPASAARPSKLNHAVKANNQAPSIQRVLIALTPSFPARRCPRSADQYLLANHRLVPVATALHLENGLTNLVFLLVLKSQFFAQQFFFELAREKCHESHRHSVQLQGLGQGAHRFGFVVNPKDALDFANRLHLPLEWPASQIVIHHKLVFPDRNCQNGA